MSHKNIIGLPVFTKSQEQLGVIVGLEIETQAQHILYYVVKNKGIIKKILHDELLVHRSQVISLDKDKLVVEDSLIEQKHLIEEKEKPEDLPASVAGNENIPTLPRSTSGSL